MKRRKFLGVLGGAAAWSLAAHAQEPDRVRRIGVLMPVTESDPEGKAFVAAFREGLQKLGWAEGRNIRIDTRWGHNAESRQRSAKELVALQPDLILSGSTPNTAALLQQTRTMVGFRQRQVRRRPPRAITTRELCAFVFPRVPADKVQRWHMQATWRAAQRFAVKLGRLPHGRGRPMLWGPMALMLWTAMNFHQSSAEGKQRVSVEGPKWPIVTVTSAMSGAAFRLGRNPIPPRSRRGRSRAC